MNEISISKRVYWVPPYFYRDAIFNPGFRYCLDTGCPIELLLVSFPEYVDWFYMLEHYDFKNADQYFLKDLINTVYGLKDRDSVFSKYIFSDEENPVVVTLGDMILKTIRKEVCVHE